MSKTCKDILISCTVIAVVASVVSYKFAELIYTIANLQQQLTEQATNETHVLGFTAPNDNEGGYDE